MLAKRKVINKWKQQQQTHTLSSEVFGSFPKSFVICFLCFFQVSLILFLWLVCHVVAMVQEFLGERVSLHLNRVVRYLCLIFVFLELLGLLELVGWDTAWSWPTGVLVLTWLGGLSALQAFIPVFTSKISRQYIAWITTVFDALKTDENLYLFELIP